MTAKELNKLSRSDLLEMLLDLTKENDKLRLENQQLQTRLEDRLLNIEHCGSLAEAALQLNGIFEATQAACEQYVMNVRQRSDQVEEDCRKMEQDTQEKCQAMLYRAQMECDSMKAKAQEESNALLAWTKVECEAVAIQNRKECDAALAAAQEQVQSLLEGARHVQTRPESDYDWLRDLMKSGETQ